MKNAELEKIATDEAVISSFIFKHPLNLKEEQLITKRLVQPKKTPEIGQHELRDVKLSAPHLLV
jgi:hypothetical protein